MAWPLLSGFSVDNASASAPRRRNSSDDLESFLDSASAIDGHFQHRILNLFDTFEAEMEAHNSMVHLPSLATPPPGARSPELAAVQTSEEMKSLLKEKLNTVRIYILFILLVLSLV